MKIPFINIYSMQIYVYDALCVFKTDGNIYLEQICCLKVKYVYTHSNFKTPIVD